MFTSKFVWWLSFVNQLLADNFVYYMRIQVIRYMLLMFFAI